MKKTILFFIPVLFLPLFSRADSLDQIRRPFLKGYRLIQKGKGGEAVPYFQSIREVPVAIRDYVLFYLAKGEWEEKRCRESKKTFQELLRKYPASRWAPLARGQASSGELCPPLREAGEEGAPCDSYEDLSKRGECLFAGRFYGEAKGIFKDLALKTAGGQGIEYLVRVSQSATRSQDYETALWANETLRERFPDRREGVEALEKIAYLHQVQGRHDLAIPILREMIRDPRFGTRKRDLYERLGWNFFRRRDYDNSVDAFDRALEIEEGPFSLYWKGRAIRKTRGRREARKIFRRLAEGFPRYYYAHRALAELPRRERKKFFRQWWGAAPRDVDWIREEISAAPSPDLRRIEALKRLGLKKEAEIEMRHVRTKSGLLLPEEPRDLKGRRDNFVFPVYSLRGEEADYPLPHSHFLFEKVKSADLFSDPLFLYAMMRQESGFRGKAVSGAGARGILQVMPATAERVARENRLPYFHPPLLFDPLTNVELAVLYVKKLEEVFDKKWYWVAAAYNAGEEVVQGWRKPLNSLPEEILIEEIPYDETRNYVKRVYANYAAYKWIYR